MDYFMLLQCFGYLILSGAALVFLIYLKKSAKSRFAPPPDPETDE